MHSLAPHEYSYPHLWHVPSTRHQTTITDLNRPGRAGWAATGWLADPSRRHELRYWDGQRWTEHVSDREPKV
ncbi:MAG TPA: DUF2510 domain-containing protein, partial [Actinomycetota bacterium]|nr:DUF2510 domain-containing protein [Actinomycetota bacterium]